MNERAGRCVKGSGRAGSRSSGSGSRRGRARAALAALVVAALPGAISCSAILGIDHEYVEGAGGAGGSGEGAPASAASSGGFVSSSGGFVSSSGGSVASSGGSSTASSSGAGGAGAPPVCGDGALDAGEQCDDSNIAAGDGCSPMCTIEVVDGCPGALVSLAPGSLSLAGVTSGAADNGQGSCAGMASPDVVYAVTPTATGTLNLNLDGLFQGGALYVRDQCESAALSAERACELTFIGAGQINLWVEAGKTYYVFVDSVFGGTGKFTLDLTLTPCGDGVVEGLEQCDDGNANAGDGCDGCVSCAGPSEQSDPATHHCYRTSAGSAAWAAARKDCIGWGGDLMALSTQAELMGVSMLCGNIDLWTGGNDINMEGQYKYTNGDPWGAFWAQGEPNGLAMDDCVKLSCQAAGLADASCAATLAYVCERAPAK